jgi:hypothetical protein
LTQFLETPQLWRELSLHEERWNFAYPGLEVQREVLRMAEWLEAHPKRKVRNFRRFMVNWLNASQARLEAVSLKSELQREAWRSRL